MQLRMSCVVVTFATCAITFAACHLGTHSDAEAMAKRPSARRMSTFLTPGAAIETDHTELLSLTDGKRTFAVLFGGYDIATKQASTGKGAFRNQDPEWDEQAGWGILHGTMPMSTTPRVATGADGSTMIVYATSDFDWVFLLTGKCAEVRARGPRSATETLGKLCTASDTGHTLSPGKYIEARTLDGVVSISAPQWIDWNPASDMGAFLAFVQKRAESAFVWPTDPIPEKP